MRGFFINHKTKARNHLTHYLSPCFRVDSWNYKGVLIIAVKNKSCIIKINIKNHPHSSEGFSYLSPERSVFSGPVFSLILSFALSFSVSFLYLLIIWSRVSRFLDFVTSKSRMVSLI